MPLPKRFPDRDEIAAVRAEADALEPSEEGPEERRLAGRVLARREMGKLVFLDLVDRSGRIQLLCPANRTGPVDVHLGDIVGAIGRPTKSRRGEPSLIVDRLEPLASIHTPLPDTFHGMTDVEQRSRRRYLDLLMNEETRVDFMLRARMVTAIRRALDDDGFVEVETPVLQPRYGGAFARPFSTHHNELDQTLYLRIATELYLKRLIVGGLERVYEIGKDFRNEGTSFKHNPEFTMLEWYEAYADYDDIAARTETLVSRVAADVGYVGELDFTPPWHRETLQDAIGSRTGVDVLAHREIESLRAAIREAGHAVPEEETWAQLVDQLLTKHVEPKLVQPTLLRDYPVELSPFAKRHRAKDGLVERWEAYAAGMEFANAFSELNDPDDQRARFEEQRAFAEAGDEEAQPYDEAYVEALEYGMPPTGGIGIGIDRLVMLLTGTRSIREVVLFPAMR